MKIILIITLTLFLTACGEIEFTPVQVEGITTTTKNELQIKSYEFTEQGDLIENSFNIINDELIEELEIEIPEIPNLNLEFTLELIDAINDDLPLDFDFKSTNNIGQFGIEFTHAGVYTFLMSQTSIESINDNWTLAEPTEIIITITENIEDEILIAHVSNYDVIFNNIFTLDLSNEIQEIILTNWEESERLRIEAEIAEQERIEAEIAEQERIEAERINQVDQPQIPQIENNQSIADVTPPVSNPQPNQNNTPNENSPAENTEPSNPPSSPPQSNQNDLPMPVEVYEPLPEHPPGTIICGVGGCLEVD